MVFVAANDGVGIHSAINLIGMSHAGIVPQLNAQ